MKTIGWPLVAALLCAMPVRAGTVEDDIGYWMHDYDGRELATPMDACEAPAIPDISRTNRDIKKVVARFVRWNDCYQSVVQSLGAGRHPVSHVPSNVLNDMTDAQYAETALHMDQVYARAVRAVGLKAAPVVSRFTAWRTKTEAFVDEAEKERIVDLQIYLYRRNAHF